MTPDTLSYYADLIIKATAAIGVGVFGYIFKKIDSRIAFLEGEYLRSRERVIILEEAEKHRHKQMNNINAQLLEMNKTLHELRDRRWE